MLKVVPSDPSDYMCSATSTDHSCCKNVNDIVTKYQLEWRVLEGISWGVLGLFSLLALLFLHHCPRATIHAEKAKLTNRCHNTMYNLKSKDLP